MNNNNLNKMNNNNQNMNMNNNNKNLSTFTGFSNDFKELPHDDNNDDYNASSLRLDSPVEKDEDYNGNEFVHCEDNYEDEYATTDVVDDEDDDDHSG